MNSLAGLIFVCAAQKEFDVNVNRKKLAEVDSLHILIVYCLSLFIGPDSSYWFLIAASSFIQLRPAICHVLGCKVFC